MSEQMPRRARIAAVVGLALFTGAAWSRQGPVDERPRPSGEKPVTQPADDKAQPLPRRPAQPVKPTGTAPEPVQPAGTREGAIPGLEDADFLIAAAPLRSEGTFLVEQRGSMIHLGTGERVFVFHADEKGKRERPMVLLPCQKLQQMESADGGGSDEPASFLVTGQVFAYRGVNYFLPTMARQVSAQAPAVSAAGEGSPAKSDEADPAVQDLIRQLEAQREPQRGTEARGSAAPAAAEGKMLAEGKAVVRRRGRMVRMSGGEWGLAFDSGTAGDVKVDRPLALSPSLNLQRMEAWAMRSGDAASFEVSGRVLAYQGRNYLMPTMFQVTPASDLEAKH